MGRSGCTADCGTPGLVCDASKCVVGCHATVGADTCPVGATCSVLGGTLGVCVGAPGDGGVGGCSADAECTGGLVCSGAPGGQCVVGCHVTAGGNTCLAGAQCSVVLGSGLGVCVGVGPDGGATPVCTTDAQCRAGLVCDSSQCVVGCHDGAAGDTCSAGLTCDVVGGGLGISVNGADAGSSSGGDDGGPTDGGGDATTLDASGGDGGTPSGVGASGDAGRQPGILEGGGCSCSSAGRGSAEGGGVAFLLGLTVLARRRKSRSSR